MSLVAFSSLFPFLRCLFPCLLVCTPSLLLRTRNPFSRRLALHVSPVRNPRELQKGNRVVLIRYQLFLPALVVLMCSVVEWN